jgi:hypothetical protein
MGTWMGHLLTYLEEGRITAERLNMELHGGKIPRFQIDAYWEDVAPLCHQRIEFSVPRGVNALNLEPQQPHPRCKYRAPDGRGLAWLNSGGSGLAYDWCCKAGCPLLNPDHPAAAPEKVPW